MRVTELAMGNRNITRYAIDGAGGKVVKITASLGEVEGKRYCVLYDTNMRILYEPSSFLTEKFGSESENTLLQAVSSMKLLFSFITILGVPFREFDRALSLAFMQFMRGTLEDGYGIVFELNTFRSESTIAAYLTHIRAFASYMGIEDSLFLAESKRLIMHSSSSSSRKAISASRAPSFEAPEYITLEQYKRIRSAIDSQGDLLARAICRLMYEHGLRIGEVLGLTLEDVKSSEVCGGALQYYVVLRNRKSDRLFQHAKTLINPKEVAVQGGKDLRKLGVGKQYIYISESLADDLIQYAESSRRGVRSVDAHADALDGGDNQYLFINSRGNPLTSNLWNKRLRKILEEVGLQVDKGSRKTNLNHRFRHGYAMLLTRVCKKGEYEVMTLMRHRSLSSTEIYQRPTVADVREIQLEVLANLASAISVNDDDDD